MCSDADCGALVVWQRERASLNVRVHTWVEQLDKYDAGTQGLTISEIVSREIDQVLFILLLSTDHALKRNIGILSRVLRSW